MYNGRNHRNGKGTVRMRKLLYMQRYSDNEDNKLEESTGKPGIHFVQNIKRVRTYTIILKHVTKNEK